MRCEVLLFAQIADELGQRRFSLQLPDGATVADAMDRLCAEHQAIAAMRGRIAVAVDESYKAPSAVLEDGCAIALIPPISGG